MADDDLETIVVEGRRPGYGGDQWYAGFGGTAADNYLLAQYFDALQFGSMAGETPIPEVEIRARRGEQTAPPAPQPSRPPVVVPTPQVPTFEGPQPAEPLEEVVVRAPRPAPPAPTTAAPIMGAVPAPTPAPQRPPSRPRRSRPAPRRTRPVRPTRRPQPLPPPARIPIKIPEVVIRAPKPWGPLTVLSLIPAYMAGLAFVDAAAQELWNDRLFGADPEDDDPERQRDIGDDAPGDREPTVDSPTDLSGDVLNQRPMPEVIVPGTRPSPFPAPSGFPEPTINPGVDAPAIPQFDIAPLPIGGPVNAPVQSPRPTPIPVADPVGVPIPDAFPLPLPVPRPIPTPAPRPSPRPPPLTPPLVGVPGPIGSLIPIPADLPVPQEELDRCKCPPKKKRKPKKPRTVCRRGTYVERATGLIKTPKEKISCQ